MGISSYYTQKYMSGTPLKCQKRWGFRGLRPLTPTKGLCPLDPRRGHCPRTPPQIEMKWRPCLGPFWPCDHGLKIIVLLLYAVLFWCMMMKFDRWFLYEFSIGSQQVATNHSCLALISFFRSSEHTEPQRLRFIWHACMMHLYVWTFFTIYGLQENIGFIEKPWNIEEWPPIFFFPQDLLITILCSSLNWQELWGFSYLWAKVIPLTHAHRYWSVWHALRLLHLYCVQLLTIGYAFLYWFTM